MSGETYDRLQVHVKANGTTGSGFVEDLLRGFFEMPEREQKAAIAPLPRFERKPRGTRADLGGGLVPPKASKPERVTVLTTPELGPEATWVEKGPADRIQVIKDVQAAKEAFENPAEDPSKKKEGVILGDMAAKIFTF